MHYALALTDKREDNGDDTETFCEDHRQEDTTCDIGFSRWITSNSWAAEYPIRPIAIAEAKTAKPKPRGPKAETAGTAVTTTSVAPSTAPSARTARGARRVTRANFFIKIRIRK
jgi:hypothetical protein